MAASADAVFYSCKALFQRVKPNIIHAHKIALPLCLRGGYLRFAAAKSCLLREADVFFQAVRYALERYSAAGQGAAAVLRAYFVNIYYNSKIGRLRFQNAGKAAFAGAVYAAYNGVSFHCLSSGGLWQSDAYYYCTKIISAQ